MAACVTLLKKNYKKIAKQTEDEWRRQALRLNEEENEAAAEYRIDRVSSERVDWTGVFFFSGC